jgi:type II secretory pathway component GspD/PulD (secretin)
MKQLLRSLLAFGLLLPNALPGAEPSGTHLNDHPAAAAREEIPGRNGLALRFAFRDAPLEAVLNYLSEAAGLVIVLETEVKGNVTAWSDHPLDLESAIQLLDSLLRQKGCAAIRNGRTLTIVTREEAVRRNLPVARGSDPRQMAPTDELATQIIPIRFANAAQISRDLQPLLPGSAKMTANTDGNAIVLTDTKASLRRMMRIVKALDTLNTSTAAIQVYPLRFADAKELASVVKDLFGSDQNRGTSSNTDQAVQVFNPASTASPGNAGGAGSPGSASSRRTTAPRVVALADERSNSLVISAPEELLPAISQLVKSIDNGADAVTELRVLRLQHADPTETAEILSGLFTNSASDSQNTGATFFAPPGMAGEAESQTPGRAGQKSRVLVVPDLRTSSLVVSASKEYLEQVEKIVGQLDANPARKQRVAVFDLANANVSSVQNILENMFQSQNTRNTSVGSQTTDPLLARQNQNSRSTGQSASGSSSSNRRRTSSGN